MMQKHRISTRIGLDQKISLELKQDYDLLEVLSLKFTQKEAYTSLCSDYGVVCGRISVNNGLGVPNARVSIFVPLSSEDENDPVISALYPYKSTSQRNDENYRYNLLPSRKQHGGHEPTGTFPDQSDILNREEVLEVYEKYYTYTVKTNDAGDFMIWGVPLGSQTIHVDVDLSDIGCFSLRPDDFIRQGIGVDKFKSTYQFKSSEDIDSLPQIISFDKTIEVYPFWGNQELCEIGITRTDFDLSERGVKIEPKAYLLGSVFSDQGSNAVNKNCSPRRKMGRKCDLISEPAVVEIIRFTTNKDSNNRPILEKIELHEDIGEDGSFVLPLPMNMDYVFTNEFGEVEVTNDPNKGVPTSSCYRFRISVKNEDLGRVRTTASYLLPNIREYATNDTEIEKSYAWSLNWEDYPTNALNDNIIFYNVYGEYYPQDYFYRFTYNKVYGVSSFMGSYFSQNGIGRDTYLGIKDISPKEEEDCESNIVTPPVNFAIKKFSFGILLATILNTFERIIYYAFIAAVQVLILPFQVLYSFRIYARALGVTIIDWRPFGFFDSLVIEPLQRFGTVRLGIAIYPECETCDNLDYSNPAPTAGDIDPESTYTQIASGTAIPDSFMSSYGCSGYVDGDASTTRLYFDIPGGTCSSPTHLQPSFISGYNTSTIVNDTTGKFIIKFSNSGKWVSLNLYGETISGQTAYYYDDTQQKSYSLSGNPPVGPQTYKIFDATSLLVGGGGDSGGLNSELEGGCQQYVTVYKETIVSGTYCVTNPSTPYSALTSTNIQSGISCSGGKVKVGQVIKAVNNNPCGTCGTHSGYSEFRYGLFTIIPAAATGNWGVNFDAITEYSKRKLVAKLFCEGVANFSFLDNWLTGSLYFFPFKAKVRWDNEQTLDLNYRRTKYCGDLVYFKVPDKKFYYRSAYTIDGGAFNRSSRNTLGHPTTIVDMGPRDEFIKEICVDPALDPNCSVVRNIGPSSYQNFKEMLGLYINYKMDVLNNGTISDFFANTGFNNVLPNKMEGYVLNGDIIQLISINNEIGIEEFDLQNKNYAAYSPQVLDANEYVELFKDASGNLNGPLPINMVLDDGEGYRVRTCLNEPGRLSESSQNIPFFLWDKKGYGFGSGVNQVWDYQNIEVQPLQGMTKYYNYTYDSTHKYVLFPMTKQYSGDTFTFTGVTFNDVVFNVESYTDTHTNYSSQEEGFTFLYITSGNGQLSGATAGTIYTRVGEATANGTTGNWVTQPWTNDVDFTIKPTSLNYNSSKQILSTPFLFYFGLRPGKTAVDKFIEKFGPKGAFPTAE